MNIKVIGVLLIIGALLWQTDASRSKSRKKLTDRRNKSRHISSSGLADDDDDDRRRKDHGSGRIHELSEKRDKKFGSSSSEENDKDGRNKTEINPGNKIHRKREAGFEKEHVKQPFLLPWTKRNTRAGLVTTEASLQIQRNGRKLLIFPAEWNKKTLPEKTID